jgi:hypothetical protein
MPLGLKGVSTAVAAGGVIFAYLGFEQAIQLGGESRNARRNIPLAVVRSTVLGLALYILLQAAFLGARAVDARAWLDERRPRRQRRELLPFTIGLGVISCLSPLDTNSKSLFLGLNGPTGTLPFGWDVLVMAVFALAIFVLAIRLPLPRTAVDSTSAT